MTRYTSFAGSIERIEPLAFGYAIVTPRSAAQPVRRLFGEAPEGVTEVDFETKTPAAKLVPYWERRYL